MTSDDVTKWIRIVVYWAAGALVSHGFMADTLTPVFVGVAGTALNMAWSVWGMRLTAKLNDIAKYAEVTSVKVTSPTIALNTPPKVTM